MGRPVARSMVGAGAAYQPGSKWAPSETDKPGWDFMQKGSRAPIRPRGVVEAYPVPPAAGAAIDGTPSLGTFYVRER